jgi:cytochrome c-type biogenesis protein CcmF
VLALALGMRNAAPELTHGRAVYVGPLMAHEIVRAPRARGRSRDEAAPTAVWRLATRNRRRYGGYVAHVGILVMAVAVAISSTMARSTTATLKPGESATLAGYTLTNDRLVIEPLRDDARVTETRAEMRFSGPQSGSLATALRDYPNSTTAIASPAVRTGLGEDLYVTLLTSDPATGSVTVRIFVNPMVVWIWIGGFILALGAGFAIWPDGRRVAVAQQAPSPAPAPVPAEGS